MSKTAARIVFVLTGAFFAVFFLWPVLQILRGGFIDADGRLTFAYLGALLTDPTYRSRPSLTGSCIRSRASSTPPS